MDRQWWRKGSGCSIVMEEGVWRFGCGFEGVSGRLEMEFGRQWNGSDGLRPEMGKKAAMWVCASMVATDF